MGVETFMPPTISHVDHVEWDDESEDLTITYDDGSQYLARNVPRGEWRRLQQSMSVGAFIHRVIKPLFQLQRI